MSIRVGQNSGAMMRFWGAIPQNMNTAGSRLMAGNMMMQQSGLKKDVAQFADSFYERQSQKQNRVKDLQTRLRESADQNPCRIAEESSSYAQSLATARTASKKTKTQVKKLQYNYKSISAQILRAKTSLSAKQVVLKAKRMVAQLKRKQGSSEYDEDELELALTHAQAMERVARKRARHLEEEELVKVSGGFCEGDLEDKLEELEDPLEKKQYEEAEDTEQLDSESMEQMMQEYERLMEEYQRMQEDSGDDLLDEYRDMMEEAMEKMLEDSGLSELEDEMFSESGREMDPADYKMMKLKHRMDELKAIAKADSAYLKGMFNKYEQDKAKAAVIFGSGAAGGGISFNGNGVQGSDTAAPISPAADIFVGGSVDISL